MFEIIWRWIGSSKKYAIFTSSLAGLSTATYFGVIKPSQDKKEVEVLHGSQPLLNRNKEVNSLARLSPSKFTPLSINHLNSRTKHLYKNSLHNSLVKSLEEEIVQATFKNKRTQKESTTLRSASNLTDASPNTAIISDIEIPYKSKLFIDQINKLNREKIIQDLLWSLAEESHQNKTFIKADSIRIDFTEEDVKQEINSDRFPIPAKRINNFQIKFTAINPHNERKTVFRNIQLSPKTETEITVTLNKSEIRPISTSVGIGAIKAVSWALFPVESEKFKVLKKTTYPQENQNSYTTEKLNLMHGRSKFISDLISSDTGKSKLTSVFAVNTPTFSDFEKIVESNLSSLTAEQAKKDIETWYGSFAAFTSKLALEDIKKMMSLMNTKIFQDEKGKSTSVLEKFSKNANWRSNLYNHLRLEDNYKKFVEKIFLEKGVEFSAQELGTLLKVLANSFEKLIESLKISLEWIETPQIKQGDNGDESKYPHISFKFKQKYTWDKDITFPFKGCWDNDQKKLEGSYESCTKEKFDFSKKLNLLHNILEPFKQQIGGTIQGIDVFSILLPDVSKFVGWEEWSIKKDESIEFTYEANNSPISAAISENSDSFDQFDVVAGWKALDVVWEQDLSNFHNFFSRIYEKIDSKESPELVQISFDKEIYEKVVSCIKDQPMTCIVHLINASFDENYLKEVKSDENKRPWPVFFKALLQKKFKIESTQLFVGYSRAFFDVKDWVLENTKESQTDNSYKLSKDWQKKEINKEKDYEGMEWNFPAKPKNQELTHVLENFSLNYSSHFPKTPIIWNWSQTESWNQFLNKEGATTRGFIKHQDKVKRIMFDNFHNYKECIEGEKDNCTEERKISTAIFPEKNQVNWEKVKISVTPLEIEQALKSVLNLKNTISSTLVWFDNATYVSSKLGLTKYYKINLSNLLGELVQRDLLFVNVNMMMEDDSLSIIEIPASISSRKVNSTYSFTVSPNFDTEKMGVSF